MKKHRSLFVMLLLVSMIWGATFSVMKEASKELDPLLIVFCRAGGASLLFGSVLLWLGKESRLQIRDVPLFFLLGLVAISVFTPLQAIGVNYTYASHASLIAALSPLMATLIAWVLGWHKMSWSVMVGLALSFSGVVLLASQSFTSAGGKAVLFGDGLILLSAVCWASFSLLGRKAMEHYSPVVAVSYVTLFGFLQLCALLLWQNPVEYYVAQLSQASINSWLCLAYLSVLASFVSFIIWYRGIEIIGPVQTTTFQYFTPLFGGVAAMWMLGESITIYLIAGGILIIGGVWLVNRGK